MELTFCVGDWLVHTRLNRVESNGRTVRLEPKVMQVLVCLAEQPGEVISKEQLLRTVWADTFVTDEVLTRSISELRRVFQDDPKAPHVIETVPKGGYRLIAAVAAVATGAGVKAEAPQQAALFQRRKRWLFFVAILVMIAAGSLAVWRSRRTADVPSTLRVNALAVLPLENLSHDPQQDYFADGMTDQLTNELAQVKSIRVVSRTSVMQFKGSNKPLPEIARMLNVDAVVEGAVLRSGARMRISAELVDAHSDKQLWAHSYEGEIGDVLQLQNKLATAITNQIQATVTPDEHQRLIRTRPIDPDAFDDYLRGQYYWNRFSEESMQKAVALFRQAIEKEPTWAPPYAGLAHSYHELAWYMPPKEVMPKAKMAAEKALELDLTSAEAHAALGRVRWVYGWDWTGADSEFQRANALNPNSAQAHAQYALFLSSAGRVPEALEQEHRALLLDPLSLIDNDNLGDILADNHQLEEAVRQLHTTISMDAEFGDAHASLAYTYAKQGRFPDAIREMKLALQYDADPVYRGNLAWIYAISGDKGNARKTIADLRRLSARQYVPTSIMAGALAELGETEQALAALEMGVQEHSSNLSMIRLDQETLYRRLRSEPRFQAVLRRIGVQ